MRLAFYRFKDNYMKTSKILFAVLAVTALAACSGDSGTTVTPPKTDIVACSSDSDCDTGMTCQLGNCKTAITKPSTPVCGNGTCETGETTASCPGDCKVITSGGGGTTVKPVCGNGTCETGETDLSCPGDCEGRLPAKPFDSKLNSAVTRTNTFGSIFTGVANFLGLSSKQTSAVNADISTLIVFANTNLENAVKAKLNITDPNKGVTVAACMNLTDLEALGKGIDSIQGLEFCSNLQILDLTQNQISDILPLGALSALRGLSLKDNHIKNIVPLVANIEAGGFRDGGYIDISSNWLDPDQIAILKNLAAPAKYNIQIVTDVFSVKLVCPGEMSLINGNTLTMGSVTDGPGQEKPAHKVTLSSFCIDTHLFTNGDKKKLANFPAFSGFTWPISRSGNDGDLQPLVNVSWDDANSICKMQGKRLPREAEWEYAAKGDKSECEYGTQDCAAPNNTNACWNSDPNNERLATCNVGLFPPNAFKLYDMAGNVWEWVSDWYATYSSDNPQGPPVGQYHVFRGGAWNLDDPFYLRANCRGNSSWAVDTFIDNIGFRCVMSSH